VFHGCFTERFVRHIGQDVGAFHVPDPASTVVTNGNARNGGTVPGASRHFIQFTPIERSCQDGNAGFLYRSRATSSFVIPKKITNGAPSLRNLERRSQF
jgi:hypothetical protein